MIFTLNTNQGPLTIDFEVKWSGYYEKYIPENITHENRPIELTQKQWDRVVEYLEDYCSEGDPDHLVKWLCER